MFRRRKEKNKNQKPPVSYKYFLDTNKHKIKANEFSSAISPKRYKSDVAAFIGGQLSIDNEKISTGFKEWLLRVIS